MDSSKANGHGLSALKTEDMMVVCSKAKCGKVGFAFNSIVNNVEIFHGFVIAAWLLVN